MTTELGELRAKLTLEAKQFKQNMQDLRNQLGQTGTSANQLGTNFSATSVASTDLNSTLSETGNAVAQLDSDFASISTSSGNLVSDLGSIQAASAALGGALVAAMGISVKSAADFEAQMSRVKAISGATDEEFKNLEASALELGASTSKSASEVAIAFEDMAAMGFNANDIIAAMPGVIAAAEASGSDLALTSGVVAAALNGFKMEAADASKVADVLAMTANVSAASVDDLGYAFKYAAPVAQTLGISLEELAAATGIMVDAGMDGSQAGTTLRMALLRLADPTKEGAEALEKLGVKTTDANGKFTGLTNMLPQFVKGLGNMTNAQKVASLATIFGAEAATGMLTVIEGGVDKFEDFTGALEDSAGASKEAADVMKDNLLGAFDEFQGALETVGIKVGNEFLPMLTEITEEGAEVVSALAEMDSSGVKSAAAFAGVTAAIGFTLSSIGKLTLAMRAFSMTPLGAAITGLSILGGMLAAAKMESDNYHDSVMDRLNAQYEEAKGLEDLTKEYDGLKGKMNLSNSELGRYADLIKIINETTDPTIVAALKDEQAKLLEKSGLTNDEMERFLDANDKIIEKVPESNTVLSDQGKVLLENADAAKALTKEMYDQLRFELEREQAAAASTIKDHLAEQNTLMEGMNNLNDERQRQLDGIKQKELEVGQAKRELADAQAAGDDMAIFKAEGKLQTAQDQLDVARIHYDQLLDDIDAQQGSLDKVNEKIGKLDKVNQQMIDLEMKMAGINYEHGQEIQAIDTEIAKLEAKKKKIQETTPEAEKNTEEHRRTVGAIDSQIQNLNNVKSRVGEIISSTETLNRELGRSVHKTVTIEERRYGRVARGKGGFIPEYHTGGVIGQKPFQDTGANCIGDDSEEAKQKARESMAMLKLVTSREWRESA